MVAVCILIILCAIFIPAIIWLFKAGYIIWRILGIIACVIAIITCVALMYM